MRLALRRQDNLVRCLDQVRRADHHRGLRRRPAREDPIGGAAHRAGHLVDRDTGTTGNQLADHPRELLDALV